ncbi:response regulator [Cellulophaga tyrosinoxydans]|jgi:CheY-like chemotaxis protein|uniref:Response regulator receiver domain-containing protein n=1 Tax=Cellulophaga tyrosinoxydans TaxID=504486 RepID=A0A1W2BH25_9FLAO|nr:response regulator [Cellulophaga tyrosinoxydans]SMC72305.1 Response regulator receiver domain-containing protein [Cellulophaga tyrosinoxydans]
MNVKSILLVDDDESTNFINSVFIKKLDIDVDVYKALNGAEALEILEESIGDPDFFPCLITLDINMPVMNGWTFLDNYKKLSPSIKNNCVIVMTTVSEDEKDLIRANKNQDIKEYFQKPMSDEKFSTLLNEYFL